MVLLQDFLKSEKGKSARLEDFSSALRIIGTKVSHRLNALLFTHSRFLHYFVMIKLSLGELRTYFASKAASMCHGKDFLSVRTAFIFMK